MAAESTDTTALSVHLNRADLHSIEAPTSFASAESFVIELDNHGEATHVHLRLDEALSTVASVPSSNHYVRPGATTRVPVSVTDPGPVSGTLTVATAYGSQTREVELAIEPTAGKRRVEIDESLIERSGDPARTTATTTTTPARTNSGTPTNAPRRSSSMSDIEGSVVLGGAAVVIVVGIALLFVEGAAVYVGALAVILGVLAAAYFLLY